MSIVVGLGIARILSGFSTLIELRRDINTDWVTIIWAVNVLGYHLLFWWVVVNNWRFLTEWPFYQFAALFLYGVLLFFCASLILPQRLEEGADLEERFESIRRPFYTLWALTMCAELLDSFLKGTEYVMSELGLPYFGLMAVTLAVPLAGMVIADRRFHIAGAVTLFFVYTYWTLSVFSTIA